MSTTTNFARRTAIGALTLAMLSACRDYTPAPTDPGPAGTPSVSNVVFCSGLEPNWVAFQDGDGEWTRAEPALSGSQVTFHHAFATNRGAIATARELAGGFTVLWVQYGTPAELAIVGDTRPDHCPPTVFLTLLGKVANVHANEVALVSAGYATRELIDPDQGNDFSLVALRPGPQDILATRGTQGAR